MHSNGIATANDGIVSINPCLTLIKTLILGFIIAIIILML